MSATIVRGQQGVSGGDTLKFVPEFGLISIPPSSPDPRTEAFTFRGEVFSLDLPPTKAESNPMNTDPANFAALNIPPSRAEANSLPTTAFFGYTTAGTTGSTTCVNQIVGCYFTVGASNITITEMFANVTCTTANKTFNMAIYNSSKAVVVQCTGITVSFNASAQWVAFVPQSMVTLTAGATYSIAVWCNSASGTGVVNYDAGTTNQGYTYAQTYSGTFPTLGTLVTNNFKYSVYLSYF
jgi:hypothetical protein